MVDGWYGIEYLRRRYGMPMGVVIPEGLPATTGYSQYTSALEQLRPGAGRVHQAVVEEVKKCAMQTRNIANPTQRMLAQVECARNIPSAMASKGFVSYSKRSRRKRRYVPSA